MCKKKDKYEVWKPIIPYHREQSHFIDCSHITGTLLTIAYHVKRIYFRAKGSLDQESCQQERRRMLHPSWSRGSLWSRAGGGTRGPRHTHPPGSNISCVIRKAIIRKDNHRNISNIHPALRNGVKPFQIREASDSQGWPPESKSRAKLNSCVKYTPLDWANIYIDLLLCYVFISCS